MWAQCIRSLENPDGMPHWDITCLIWTCDVLADLLELTQHFVTRLKVYIEIPRTLAIENVVVEFFPADMLPVPYSA